MQFPSTPNEWKGIAENFLKAWQLPHCCGSIDGKHVLMVCPKNSGSLNFNYKGTFSNVLLAVADANYKFLYIDYGHYGSESDGGIFRKVQFGQMMETCRLNLPNDDYLPNSEIMFPFYFIGDEAFPLKRNLMRPYPRRSAISRSQRVYNYRLCRARRVVENAFGILSSRFRIFKRPLTYSEGNTTKMVLAACILHNFLIRESACYINAGDCDSEDEHGNLIPGRWRATDDQMRSCTQVASNMYSTEARELRNKLADYLCTTGSCHRQ
ncbi:protein ANTAGONIST OF LIKE HETEROCHROMATIN PROTEIN 1-like [Centruroides sculpturatus]|uniref:protein ANTAGONIST OF LIKE HETEROCHROMATIN PROTEIN 1-like n=1 Tax=Centruroides sculpturatus TaxID=218467 RepID=UPI000C6CFA65|nr:protein ANTAGONIST OF LIKE HETEROCHROMATIN PROTEIN 1-like [Centruroides sculpturatus]